MTARDCLALEIERLLARVPESFEPESSLPDRRAQELGKSATLRAAAISTGLALPKGSAGLLGLIPDLMVVWHIQTALVADIAACYGQTAKLHAGTMATCLFSHLDSELCIQHFLDPQHKMQLQPETQQMVGKLAHAIGARMVQRLLGRAIGRWVPFVGALGLGALTAYDTDKVAQTAKKIFSGYKKEAENMDSGHA